MNLFLAEDAKYVSGKESTLTYGRNVYINVCVCVGIFEMCAENRDDIVAIDRRSFESLFPLSPSLFRDTRRATKSQTQT